MTVRVVRNLLLAVVLCGATSQIFAQSLPAAVSEGPRDPGCGSVEQSVPPEYPAEEKAKLIGGRTVLLIILDACGRPFDLQVEKSSGNRNLDRAAMSAARSWRFNVVNGKPGTVRVPVNFSSRAGEVFAEGRTRDENFTARRSQRVQAPVMSATGQVPGLVPDPYGFGYQTVAQAYMDIRRVSSPRDEPDSSFETFMVVDEEGLSQWSFSKPEAPYSPSAIRFRAVGNGSRGFYVVSSLCEAKEAAACSGLQDYLDRFPEQNDIPPPPPAPGN